MVGCQNISIISAPHTTKRRFTPNPPGPVKRGILFISFIKISMLLIYKEKNTTISVPCSSSPISQASSQVSQGFAAKRAAHAARMRDARARESQEQTAARNAKKNKKQRIARGTLSQVKECNLLKKYLIC